MSAGTVSNGKVFAEMPKPSITDGVRTDTEGRVWLSVGWGDPKEDGVRCYTSAGELLGKIHIPERSPICASAVSNETGCTSAARRRSMPSTPVCRIL